MAMTWAYASSKGWFIGGSIDGTYLRISWYVCRPTLHSPIPRASGSIEISTFTIIMLLLCWVVNSGTNRNFYGKAVESEDILSGKVPQPMAAQALYSALEEVLRQKPSEMKEQQKMN